MGENSCVSWVFIQFFLYFQYSYPITNVVGVQLPNLHEKTGHRDKCFYQLYFLILTH